MSAKDAAGHFVWYDLMSKDPEGAKAFYPHVVGWGSEKWDGGGMPYDMWSASGEAFAGLMRLPEAAEQMGAPSHWLGYVAMEDLDAAVSKAEGLGAKVLAPAMAIPTVGRIAVLADPQGAAIAFFTPETMAPSLPAEGALGRVGWHELYTSDLEAGWAFYQSMFGWQVEQDMDMGPMGVYRMYKAPSGRVIGGMMKRPADMPVSAWNYYFNVPALDEAVAGATSRGAVICNPAMQVPGGSWVAMLSDPSGAVFALVAPTR